MDELLREILAIDWPELLKGVAIIVGLIVFGLLFAFFMLSLPFFTKFDEEMADYNRRQFEKAVNEVVDKREQEKDAG